MSPVIFVTATNQSIVIPTIIVCAIAALFALLHIIAATSQLHKGFKPSHMLMLSGGLGVVAAIIDCLVGGAFDWLLMLVGGGMVCIAAIMNGKAAGKLNPVHHIIRGLIVLLLTLAFYIFI